MPYIKAGYRFKVNYGFVRAKIDTPVTLAPDEHANPRHVIGYINGDPNHTLGFMRHPKVRVHVQLDAIAEAA